MSFYRDFHEIAAVKAWNTAPRRSYETIKLTPVSPVLGAEVGGVDLSKDIPDHQFEEIRQALAENLVLVFRNQPITTEDQKRFGQKFGKLHNHLLAFDRKVAGGDADPELLTWRTGADSERTAGDGWHADVSCDPVPISASILRVTKIPPNGGGDTLFANAYLAYESLSDSFKTFLDGLSAIHDGAEGWTAGYGAKPKPGSNFPTSEHPVVPRHPITGRKFLYVNQAFTTHIPQLRRTESAQVLNFLFHHIESSVALQARVRWQPDTVVVWDNWATQHHAVWDYHPFERWGVRVSAVPEKGPQA